jgi:hypothetical protein
VWKYATEHVKVIVEHGHVLTDMKAAAYIIAWRDGKATREQGLPRMAPNTLFQEYDKGFYAGYDAPQDTLPPGVTWLLVPKLLVEKELKAELIWLLLHC